MQDFEKKVLSVKNITRQFGEGCEYCNEDKSNLNRNYCSHCYTIYACRDVSFDLYEGEILGIVGESGSGKSTLVRSLYFEQEVAKGEVYLFSHKEGKENIFNTTSQQKRYLRDYSLGMVYQNPYLGLQMKFSAISNIAQKLIAAGSRNVGQISSCANELLDVVKIEEFRRKDAPSTFSGGMQQRVQIAKALSNNPPVLFLDEVTTGLDLSVQANVLDLIRKIQRDLNISMIIVSHDLGVIKMLANRTLVMLEGCVIESGLTDQILEDPQQPYTQQLVHSLL
ncbi:MAG: ATP-binding cassette domain-containing protein [Clostridiales bacterium]|nr:ATP-binding cassette domain-containing protein [Clostridiales bacterium]